jgi:hypothetical protein
MEIKNREYRINGMETNEAYEAPVIETIDVKVELGFEMSDPTDPWTD